MTHSFQPSSDLLVNTTTLNQQHQATITSLASGGFVVSWADNSGQSGESSLFDIRAQIFNASGVKVGSEFLVNSATLNDQVQPKITGLASGGFVVSWQDHSGEGGDSVGSGIKAQIFNASGEKVGAELLVNTATPNDQEQATITGLASGGFVVSWQDHSGVGGDGSGSGIKAQLFDAGGGKVGAEFLVNTATLNDQGQPTITSLASGGFVVSWTDQSGVGDDNSTAGIKAQLFDGSGAKVGGEFLVNSATRADQFQPTITGLVSGGFVVSWADLSAEGGDFSGFGIKAQKFDASGAKIGAEFLVNTSIINSQFVPTITGLASGGFVIGWQDYIGQVHNVVNIFKAQHYDAGGARVGGEFSIVNDTLSDRAGPTLASLASGGFVAGWTDTSSSGGDTSSSGIKARIFNPRVNDAPTGSVTIAGTAAEGQIVTASNTLADADGLGAISYQWLRGGVAVAGATGATYTLSQADVGQAITVAASYTDQHGTAERVASAATAAVANVITGDGFNNLLQGSDDDDRINGGGGNDIFSGGAGNDILDGGNGFDTAIYSDLFRSYDVAVTGGTGSVKGANEGTDTLRSIEVLQFRDGKFDFDADGVAAQVTRLYDTVLQRAPDQIGLDFWVDKREDFGGTLKDVANSFLNSAEFQARTGKLSNSEYVEFLYNNALGRAADADGKAYWVGRLSAGSDRADLLIGFSESLEHRALTADLIAQGFFNTNDSYQAVALLYDSFAGREPDAGGLIYWGDAISSGAISLQQAAEGFAKSAEFLGRIAGMSHADLVDYMYRNTLDRGADQAGRDYWVARLDSGMSYADLLLGFSQSTEHSYLLADQITRGIDYF